MILHGADRPDLIVPETLADLLYAAVRRSPSVTAIEDGELAISYELMQERAQAIAAALSAKGCGPGFVVGLWLPRGHQLILAQIGITLSGAAWLPFDADAPVERLVTCMRDAQARFVVTDADGAEMVRARGLEPLLVTDLREGRADRELSEAKPEDIAYIIYTSGSTGTPKGIAITQQNVCHLIRSENQVLGIQRGDRVYQGFSVAFDMAVEEIWISIFAGATIWVAPKEMVADPERIEFALLAQRITVFHAVPTLAALISHFPKSLRLINLGGEACPESLAAKLTGNGYKVFNSYGPTETTVTATIAELTPGQAVTIGKPLPNYGVGICNPERQLLPLGATGEIVIFGPGVALGYLERPELTAAKFVTIEGRRAYLSGDLGCIENDEVRCFGRVDNQIKLRGFRIELDEISAVLAAQPGVYTAATVVRAQAGADEIVGFVVSALDGPTAAGLRRALSLKLPAYMVPGRFEFLKEMPRLTSGKIDLGALRSIKLGESGAVADSPSPANEHEAALRAVLTELFPGVSLAPNLDFFSDLGGHSLLVARLVTRLRQDPRYAQIEIQHIYSRRTIAAIASSMSEMSLSAGTATPPPYESAPFGRRLACGIAQAIFLPFLMLIQMMQWLAPFFAYHWLTGDVGDSLALAMIVALGAYLFSLFLSFVGCSAGCWWVDSVREITRFGVSRISDGGSERA